jgi:hypothetical protein
MNNPKRKSNPSQGAQAEAPPSHPDLRLRISERAYELFLKRGGSHGRDREDWLEAERLVRTEVRVRGTSRAPETEAIRLVGGRERSLQR